MEPSGHLGLKSYFFFFFLCILTGVATVIHQVIVASDHLPKSKGMHAHRHSVSCATPGDWFLVTPPLMVMSAPELLVPSCAQKGRSTLVCQALFGGRVLLRLYRHHQISGDKMVPCVGAKSCFDSLVTELLWWW